MSRESYGGTFARRCAACGGRLGSASWCPLCHASTSGLRRDHVAGRPAWGAADRVDWRRVNASSRWRATSTSFSAPTKVLLTLPAYVVPVFWLWSGAFRQGAVALSLGGPQVLFALWWTWQVWRQGGRLA